MIRVFVADDHTIVREGLKRVLDETVDMSVCGEATSAPEVLERLAEARSDVVVLDVNMPGSHGTSLVKQVLACRAPPRVVIFTMYPEDGHAVAFLRAGASAFISKRHSSLELVEAIRRVHSGRRYISPALADFLFEHQIDLRKTLAELLSDREVQVVRALAEGKRAVDIAAESGVTPSTINTFVHRIKTKLGVRTVVEVVQSARDAGLVG